MATLGLSKVFILDKYFAELQKFWETERKLQDASSSNEAVHLQQRLKSLSCELVTLRNRLHVTEAGGGGQHPPPAPPPHAAGGGGGHGCGGAPPIAQDGSPMRGTNPSSGLAPGVGGGAPASAGGNTAAVSTGPTSPAGGIAYGVADRSRGRSRRPPPSPFPQDAGLVDAGVAGGTLPHHQGAPPVPHPALKDSKHALQPGTAASAVLTKFGARG